MVATAALLLPAALVAPAVGLGGWLYTAGAVVAGGWFLAQTCRFARERTDRRAKAVLRASIIYLPAVLGLLLLDALVIR
jgi:protoheme IX farnesyltransferase